MTDITRLQIENIDDENEIEEILEENNFFNYDWDDGERLMVEIEDRNEIIEILEHEGYIVNII